MKNILIKNIFGSFLTLFLMFSCETTELDLSQNPNRLPLENADPRALLNGLPDVYIDFIDRMGEIGSRSTRLFSMSGNSSTINSGIYSDFFSNSSDPDATLSGEDLLNAWNAYYRDFLPNMIAIEELALKNESNVYDFHLAIVKIMKAHMASVLVDYYGDIVYTEANNLLKYQFPKLDKGEDVYNECFTLLNEAVTLLETDPFTVNLDDRFYDGDATKWIKLANTLKLRMYKNMGNTSAFNAIIASGKFIATSADDMVDLNTGANDRLPGDKFSQDYRSQNSRDYKSNWLMRTMVDLNDPRLRYYFYRQTNANPEETELPCVTITPPSHYVGYDYCVIGNGYIGRAHGSDVFRGDEITDGDIVTMYGVYPYGGRFDDDSFESVGEGGINGEGTDSGAKGVGIIPIVLASDVDFWRGQMASSVSDKANFLRAGLEKSITKVQSFGANDATADLSLAPNATAITNYIDQVVANYLSASGNAQENIYAVQYFISMYGNGLESYNYYRKTGYPTSLTPSWDPTPGPFPRSFLYPSSEVLNNPSIAEVNKKLTDQVFWDTNPASPAFPIAN